MKYKNLNKIIIKKNVRISKVLEKIESTSNEFNIPKNFFIIVDKFKKIIGTLSDGDLRRFFLNGGNKNNIVFEAMNKNPIVFDINESYENIKAKLPIILKKKSRKSKNFLDKIILVKSNIPKIIIDYDELNIYERKIFKNVSVVGLGYVGLTFGLFLAKSGFKVFGIDQDIKKIKKLKKKQTYIYEKGIEKILKEQLNVNLFIDTKLSIKPDVYIIAVSTPVDGNGLINIKYLVQATKNVAKNLTPNSLVLIRSTVPIGYTRKIVVPILEKYSKLKAGLNFFVSFAPERTLTGNAMKELMDLPQIISGFSERCLKISENFFKNFNSNIVKVENIEIAEISKLMNNSIRDLKFSFSNQMAEISAKFNIDINKSISASNQSYPRDIIPYPSIGVGGSCLTKDPYILSQASDNKNNSINILARRINENSVKFHFNRINMAIKKRKINIKNLNVMICGLAFKGNPETGDIRNSTSIELAKMIKKKYKRVYGFDPIVEEREIKNNGIISCKIPKDFKNKDVVIFMTNHSYFRNIDFTKMIKKMKDRPIIFDVWNNFPLSVFSKSKNFTLMNLSTVKDYF